MEMQKKTTTLIGKLVKRFDEIKNKDQQFGEVGSGYGKDYKGVLGQLWWNNPNIIWVYSSKPV